MTISSKRVKTSEGYELTFDSEWTQRQEGWRHWLYYWNQARLVKELVDKTETVVEVGVGTRFLSNYLRSRGWSIITMDIDSNKEPDIVCDVSSYDFAQLSPDCILAFEVFEHLPFPLFRRTVSNLERAGVHSVLFSIPWARRSIGRLEIKLPKLRPVIINVSLPRRHVSARNHFWELKKNGRLPGRVIDGGERGIVPLSSVFGIFEESGYRLRMFDRIDRIQLFGAFKE